MDNPSTAHVAQFVAETDWEKIPANIHPTAKYLIFDHLCVTLAGSRSDAGRLVQEYVDGLGGPPEAPILGTRRRVPVPFAALANGVAAGRDSARLP